MSNGFFGDEVPVILGVAESEKKDKIKASCRATKDAVEDGLNLGEVIEEICEEIDGEGGGPQHRSRSQVPDREKTGILLKWLNKKSENLAKTAHCL